MHKVENIGFLFLKGNRKGEVKCLNVHYATTGLFPHLSVVVFLHNFHLVILRYLFRAVIKEQIYLHHPDFHKTTQCHIFLGQGVL